VCRLGRLRLCELVVRRTGNDAAPKTRHDVHVQDAPNRARRVNVAIGLDDAVGSHGLRVHARCDALGTRGVDVGDEDGGTSVRQMLRKRRADSAHALDEDSSPSTSSDPKTCARLARMP
jgi:hypothetical protein